MYHNTRKTGGRPGGICNIKKRSEDAVLGYGVYQVTKDDCEKCVLGRSGGGIPSDRYGSELLQRRGGEKRYKEIRAIFGVHGAERNMAAKAVPPRTANRGKGLPCLIPGSLSAVFRDHKPEPVFPKSHQGPENVVIPRCPEPWIGYGDLLRLSPGRPLYKAAARRPQIHTADRGV